MPGEHSDDEVDYTRRQGDKDDDGGGDDGRRDARRMERGTTGGDWSVERGVRGDVKGIYQRNHRGRGNGRHGGDDWRPGGRRDRWRDAENGVEAGSRHGMGRGRAATMPAWAQEGNTRKHRVISRSRSRSRSPPGRDGRERRRNNRDQSSRDSSNNQEGDLGAPLPTDPEELMRHLMGFSGFGTTQGSTAAANKGTVAGKGFVRRGTSTRQYRQYMNRAGGFNRPLDAPKKTL